MHKGSAVKGLLFFPNKEKTQVNDTTKIRDALAAISNSGAMVACIIDSFGVLKGLVTDSDIRRSLLKGASIDDSVLKCANLSPLVAESTVAEEDLLALARTMGKREIPLVDNEGRLVDIFVLGLFETRKSYDEFKNIPATTRLVNEAIILAGGKGARLKTVVSDRPKSLALIGEKPIIEILMDRLVLCGIDKFYISVNYMADQIRHHFKSEKYKSLVIRFIQEEKPLGTAGSIAYVKNEITHPVLVCNADVLTKVPFDQVISYHQNQEADITCVVRAQKIAIPYGVIEIEDDLITGVREKPQIDYLASAGIYVLSPTICQLLSKNEYMDMPELIELALKQRRRVVPFMLHEYWLDVGVPNDYRQANEDYSKHFGEV